MVEKCDRTTFFVGRQKLLPKRKREEREGKAA